MSPWNHFWMVLANFCSSRKNLRNPHIFLFYLLLKNYIWGQKSHLLPSLSHSTGNQWDTLRISSLIVVQVAWNDTHFDIENINKNIFYSHIFFFNDLIMTKLVGVPSAFIIFIRLFYQAIMKKHLMHTKPLLRLELISCGAFKHQGFVAINVLLS